jgi:hypothetical protein
MCHGTHTGTIRADIRLFSEAQGPPYILYFRDTLILYEKLDVMYLAFLNLALICGELKLC